MSILKIARLGHPVLRHKARPIERSDIKSVSLQSLIDDLIETMGEYHGVGLAGPQVHEPLRLFVALVDSAERAEGNEEEEPPPGDPVVFINPEVTPIGKEVLEDWEGCLSIPDIRGRVPRAGEVNIRAFDRHGERFELHLRRFPARVVQHEYDHLDGVLFLDRMRSFESLTFLEEYARYWTKDRD